MSATLPRCRKDHPLKWTTRTTTCDLCRTRVEGRMYACVDCNYDACASCYAKPILSALPSDVRNYTGPATATLFKTTLNRNYLNSSSAGSLSNVNLEHWGCYIHLEDIDKHVRVEYGGGTGRILPGGTSAADRVVVWGDASASLKNEAGDYVTWRVLSDDEYEAEVADMLLVEDVDGRRPNCNIWYMVHYGIEYLAVEYNALRHSCQDFARGVLKDVMRFTFEEATQGERATTAVHHAGVAHAAAVAATAAVGCVIAPPVALAVGIWVALASVLRR